MTNRAPHTFEPAVQAALTTYITDLFVKELPQQRQINQTAEQAGLPAISLRPHEGWLLYFLTQLIQAEKAIEIGTLAGYSASWLLRALPASGRLVCLEAQARYAEIAQANLKTLEAAASFEVLVGDARQTLNMLDGPFDLVFIDADKTSYPDYLAWAIDNVRSGGLILAHNAFRGGAVLQDVAEVTDEGQRANLQALQAFNRQVATDERLTGIIIPAGDGMLAARVN